MMFAPRCFVCLPRFVLLKLTTAFRSSLPFLLSQSWDNNLIRQTTCHSDVRTVSFLGGGFKYLFYFRPYLGKIPILTHIFQMSWNHQRVIIKMMDVPPFRYVSLPGCKSRNQRQLLSIATWTCWLFKTQWNWEGTPGRYPLKWVPKNPLKWC